MYSYNSTMTKQDWENVDLSSRELVKKMLLSMKTTKNVEYTTGNCSYDLLATQTSGKRIAVEIKDRSFSSTRYGDIFAEEIKETCNQRRMDKGEFDKILAVNVFTDNVIAIANLKDPDARHFTCNCPTTSRVKGATQEYISKECVSLPQTLRVKYLKKKNRIIFEKL